MTLSHRKTAVVVALLAMLVACDSSSKPRASSDARPGPTIDAPAAGSRFAIVTLHWVQVVDRREPDDAVVASVIKTLENYEEVIDLSGYDARPPDRRPEIRRGEWLLAVPESAPVTFDLVVDAHADYRLLVLAAGWKPGSDGK